jgi:hypothetical protein
LSRNGSFNQRQSRSIDVSSTSGGSDNQNKRNQEGASTCTKRRVSAEIAVSISAGIACGVKVVRLANATDLNERAVNVTKKATFRLGGVRSVATRYEPKSAMAAKSSRSRKRWCGQENFSLE